MVKVSAWDYKKALNLQNKVIICDPIYHPDTLCLHKVDNMLPGSYTCTCALLEFDDDARVAYLLIHHQKYPSIRGFKLISDIIGVDSAHAGFFDFDFYAAQFLSDEAYDKWLDESSVHHDAVAKIIQDKGVVSRTGYGDGLYSLYSRTVNGFTVALKLVFIEEEEIKYLLSHLQQ